MSTIFPVKLTGACVVKHGKRIVGPVDLELGAKGVSVVLGPNGAGKTTFLRLLHGLERSRGGQVTWQVRPDEARKRQAFVFQFPITMRRSVLDNIAYPLRLRGVSRLQARSQAAHWAGQMGLGNHLARPAEVLSGGERQKLALARALITEPELLILDEPTSNLDGASMREFEVLLAQAIDRGTRVIMATHDLGQARRLASEVVFLRRGQMDEFTPAARFFDTPVTAKAAAFLNGDIVE